MSTSSLTIEQRRSQLWLRFVDYVELTKPRIAALELLTLASAAVLAGLSMGPLTHALIGTALVAASASALNQWIERERDARMERTATRPLPSGRLAGGEVVVFGLVTLLLGGIYLAVAVNLLTAGLGLLSWVLYVVVYTPLKSRTTANTMVGAVAGALPVLMGWTAMGAPLGMKAAALFVIVFLWQFPHFMAIAWIYRKEYAAAGFKMLPVVEPSGLRSAGHAVVASLVLLPVSLVPAMFPLEARWLPSPVYLYAGLALVLGAVQFGFAIHHLLERNDQTARGLLRASLVYLPAVFLALVLLRLTSPI